MKSSVRTAVVAAVIAAAAVIRLAGINSQLWLDEIWSIRLAQTATSAWDVFFLHHDNNHWLNTLWVYFLGLGRAWWVYHIPAEITGIGTVILGYLVSRRNVAVLILLASSEFLVEYSTEARGYAPAGFFALLCLWLLQCHLAKPRRITAAAMACCAVAGLLSHLTFVVILAGLAAASVEAVRVRRGWGAAMAQTAIWWILPVAVVVLLYLMDVQYMTRGGGPPTPSDLAAQAAGMILGVGFRWLVAGGAGVLAVVLGAVQCVRMYRRADALWAFYGVVLMFVPALLIVWPRTDYIHPRYLYVAVSPLLILVGLELSRWFEGSRWAKFSAAGLMVGFVIANGVRLATFFHFGRGDYRAGLLFMIEQTHGGDVVIGSDRHPESTMMVLQYYDKYHLQSASHLLTLGTEDWGDQWPQWMVAEEDLGPRVATAAGVPFVRRARFPTGAATSGISWTIYEAEIGRAFVRAENLRKLSP